ncbi:MAG TPA: hypothetical protein VHA37_02680, partial [Candidatus Saccharimonadales bacterium]|nr:hypothetical protein [Candidatus Saccharimonadales bacterium]
GFTIIEVVIVLAIAALILLIVFLALPALQRSQRNTSRKSDAGHISSAINDFVSNNNGALPGATAGTWGTDCATIVGDAGTLSQYTAGNGFACGGVGTGAKDAFQVKSLTVGNTVTMTAVAGQAMVLIEASQCPTTASTTPTTVAATTPRQASLMYTVEQSSGNWLWDCVQSE